MAENNTSSVDDVRKDLEKQIADLKKEVTKLSKSLAERGEAAFDEASNRARAAAQQARTQAHVVTEAIRENPGTAATVLSSAGIIGFVIGLVVGQALSSDDRRSHRWY